MHENNYNLLVKARVEIDDCETLEEVYKIYRQLRIWNRLQWKYAQAYDINTYHMLNEEFKKMRNDAKERLS